jgi:hypothetical protein
MYEIELTPLEFRMEQGKIREFKQSSLGLTKHRQKNVNRAMDCDILLRNRPSNGGGS